MQLLMRTGRHVLLAVLPVAIVVLALQFALTMSFTPGMVQFLLSAGLVVLGLTLFLFAAENDLLPIGESIGAALPRLGRLWLVCLVGAVVGFVVTVAEPDVRVLTQQVDLVSGGAISRLTLILSIGAGVGIAVALALLRIALGVPLRLVFLVGYLGVFALAAAAPPEFLPVSFDAGGVTTGPMTVPFIIALGVGVASVLSGRTASGDGFGYIGLASIGPLVAVLILGMLAR